MHRSPLRVAGRFPIVLAVAVVAAASSIPSLGAETKPIVEKTLVVWAAPANLSQQGGSALTIEKPGGVFDAIVLGEQEPGKWMAGSNTFKRTQQDQSQVVAAPTVPTQPVQIAIVYQGNRVTMYRNGKLYTTYEVPGFETYADDSLVLIGLRHRDANPDNCFFCGAIEDARLYDCALTDAQIQSLRPNRPSKPAPVGWWDFENGSAKDRMDRFPVSTLLGDARLIDGQLHLDGDGDYLMATATMPDLGSEPDRDARSLREKLLGDPYRPGYHFVTPEGRCMPFDPNGAIFWKGRYHLFYIYQSDRDHHWGHVSSTDLFHWRHHPTGLISGMFSGNCFINKDGRPTMCYHQVGQGNAMAVALDDELNQWKKLESNPITPPTKPGDAFHDKYRSWDPYGWIEDDSYYAIFGGQRPAIAKAPALGGPWKYVGDLMANSVAGASINEDVSCADFFRLGDQRMLLCISHRLGCRYYLGQWKNEQFHPTYHAKMSWVDNSFFAPESLLDDKGRRIMWAWIFDTPQFGTRMDYGWSGTMSLPRVLTLGADGTLHMQPPVEVEALRYNSQSLPAFTLAADTAQPIPAVHGNSLELEIETDMNNATQFGVKVCCSPSGDEQTLVYYDATSKKLVVDTTKASLTGLAKSVEAGPFTLPNDEPLTLRVFVDKSVVEVFANGRQAVMRRIYPTHEDSTGVAVFARGGPVQIKRMNAWDMMPSNPY